VFSLLIIPAFLLFLLRQSGGVDCTRLFDVLRLGELDPYQNAIPTFLSLITSTFHSQGAEFRTTSTRSPMLLNYFQLRE
jgi:hypothetical protein